MRTLLVLSCFVVAALAFDCYGRNSSCAESHTKCDTGYDPFCEHFPGPMGRYIGICTCDKECQAASECSNTEDDGCPERSHPVCDMTHHVCECFPHPPPPETNESHE